MKRHCNRAPTWLISLLTALPALALAQAGDRVKPELMLLIDSSGSMQWTEGGGVPACSSPDTTAPDPNVAYQRSRMMIAKDVLAGSSLFQPWCVEHDRWYRHNNHSLGANGSIPHLRPMCCASVAADGSCGAWAPCGNDHGADDGAPDATPLGVGQAFSGDGLVFRELERIKFGLMTFDTNPSDTDDGDPDDYSYGSEDFAIPWAIKDRVGEVSSRGVSREARGHADPNFGARGAAAPFGGLVSSNAGLLLDDGTVDSIAEVGETVDRVRQHNRLVMERIRRIVPFGGTPIAPLLHDAKTYFEGQLAPDVDPGAACRKRFAVLITDGEPTAYYGGQGCIADADCGDRGECVQRYTNNYDDVCPCDLGEDCVGGWCQRLVGVCAYPEGYPYETSETYAAALYEMGIPTFVIGFNVDALAQAKAESIAAAGAPGLGVDEGQPGFFLASDEGQLRDALRRISNAALAGLRTRARPLALTPSTGDYTRLRDVRQWRFFTFSEVPGSQDDARYGRVESVELGCAPDPTPAPGLDDLGHLRFDERLADRVSSRRVVSRDPLTGQATVVAGGVTSVFADDGTLGGLMDEARVRALIQTPAAEDAEGDRLRLVGHLLHGLFGERGLPEGPLSDVLGQRQLGEILEGDMVAIQPPNLGVRTPAYTRFANRMADRPTLVALGARDGMIHVFRAQDGHEVFSFVPRLAWPRLRDGHYPTDGPLATADIIRCRTLSGPGDDTCPAERANVQFNTILVGGVGRAGGNLFGVDVTNIAELAQPGEDLTPLADTHFTDLEGRPHIWDVTDASVADSTWQEPKLGLSVSRPAITHVRQGDRVVPAVVVGCGEDPAGAALDDPAGVGRCVLVLNALTGALIRRLETPAMTRPMVGSPSVYPYGGVTPAERAYLGDAIGRVWRVDLRSTDPAAWSVEMVWPPADLEARAGYETGRALSDRPALALQADGRLAVTFTTGGEGDGTTATSFAVSFDDTVTFAADGTSAFQVETNWVMPMLPAEHATGAPIVRDGVMYFTTTQGVGDDACVTAQGRLYGVHYTDTLVDAAGAPDTFVRDDPQSAAVVELNVKPELPLYGDDGAPSGNNALAVLLPPGRVAHGLTIVSTPSCTDGAPATTELVLNLADESQGAAGALDVSNQQVEELDTATGRIQPAALDGRMFTRAGARDLTVCLDCDKEGNPAAAASDRAAPFPSQALYWGGTFAN